MHSGSSLPHANRPMSALLLRPMLWPAPAWRLGAGLLGAVCMALGAQAAVVQVPVDLLRPGGGLAAPAASTLERALTVDTNTSQRNLDLLIDVRRAGDAAGSAVLRTGEQPTGRPALPMAESRGTLAPLGLQTQDSVTAPGAAERRQWQGNTAAGFQSALPGSRAGGADFAREAPGTRQSERADADGVPSELSQLLIDLQQFLRENRFWLLGGLGLLAIGAAMLQLVTRRR